MRRDTLQRISPGSYQGLSSFNHGTSSLSNVFPFQDTCEDILQNFPKILLRRSFFPSEEKLRSRLRPRSAGKRPRGSVRVPGSLVPPCFLAKARMGDPKGETEGGRFSLEEADAGDDRAFACHLARSTFGARFRILGNSACLFDKHRNSQDSVVPKQARSPGSRRGRLWPWSRA
jgi:hypothetical protein